MDALHPVHRLRDLGQLVIFGDVAVNGVAQPVHVGDLLQVQPVRPLFLTLPSCPVILQWNGSIMPEVTPVRRICARWVTSGGSSRLSSTSMTPLFMPHQ